MQELTIDTNILIRYLIKDVLPQYRQAKQIFEEIEKEKKTAFVSILVINEIIWVLENYYELKRNIYLPKLLQILILKNIKILELNKEILIKILQVMQKTTLDFTDLYLIFTTNKNKIFSFDKDFKKYVKI